MTVQGFTDQGSTTADNLFAGAFPLRELGGNEDPVCRPVHLDAVLEHRIFLRRPLNTSLSLRHCYKISGRVVEVCCADTSI